LPPSAMTGSVVSANASTRPAQKSDFICKTPPAEVVKGSQAARWGGELAAHAEKIADQHVEPGIDLEIAQRNF